MNICMVCPYFQSKKYDLKLRTDVLEVSCRLIKGGAQGCSLTSRSYGAPSHEVFEGVEVHRIPALA